MPQPNNSSSRATDGIGAPTATKPFGHGLADQMTPELMTRAASSDCTLLVTGETGVGKGHLAKWIHSTSPRRSASLIPVNCGAIPESLIDSQLFGHVRGAFSGATTDHLGLVRAAEGGTLLLDEISELPLSAQTRLLRLLQEREVQPVGQPRPIAVDVRVVAATNIDLTERVAEKTFREDLLYRLDVIQIRIKPLRARRHEIPELIEAFNHEFANIYDQQPLRFDGEAMQILLKHHWPGNIRQLRTVIERMHVLFPDIPVTEDQLAMIGKFRVKHEDPIEVLDRIRTDAIKRVLDEAGGSINEVAERYGVHRSTIYRWLKDDPQQA